MWCIVISSGTTARHDKMELILMLVLIAASIFTTAALLLALVEKIKTVRLEKAVARHNARMDDVAAQLARDIIAGRAV